MDRTIRLDPVYAKIEGRRRRLYHYYSVCAMFSVRGMMKSVLQLFVKLFVLSG